MKRLKLLFIIFVMATFTALLAVGCSSGEYKGKHTAPTLVRNEVLPIERNSLSFALDMEIDELDVIEKAGCYVVDADGNEIAATKQTLSDGTFSYEHFELDTVGSDKRIKISYGDAANYITYEVNKYSVNFYTDEEQTELWKNVTAMAELNNDLGLAVWVDIGQNNYSVDELARESDGERAMLFNGWYDFGDNSVTGLHVLGRPASGNERVLNLHAHYMTEEEYANYDITYNVAGDRVFNGYKGGSTTRLIVPEGVTYIDFGKVFAGDIAFENMHIPSTARVDVPLGRGIDTSGLTGITVDSGNLDYAAFDGALYSKNYETLYIMPSDCLNATFHESVSEFGSYSCAYWHSSEVTIPDSVVRLNHYCFAHSRVSKVKGLETVKSIMSGVFFNSLVESYNDGYASYNVLKDGKYILSLVYGKTATPEYSVRYDTVAIAGDAFKNRTDLVSITLCDGLESIGSSAFSGCTSLTEIEFPSSLIHMGSNVFYGCTSLTTVKNLQDVVYTDDSGNVYTHTLPSYTFYNCRQLSSITLAEGTVTVGPYAFYNCAALTHVDLPSTVTAIGSAALYGCGITSIELPTGLRTIGASAFARSRLTSIDLSTCPNLMSLPRGCFSQTRLVDVTIPDWITTVPYQCFSQVSTLKRINLNKVVTIEEQGFISCSGLTDIAWGSSIKYIGERAFSGCSQFISIVIPNTVETIAYRAFINCNNLKSLTLGRNVKDFGVYSYLSDGVTFDAGSPALFGLYYLETINVVDGNTKFKVIDGALYGNSVCGIDYGEGGVLYAVPPVYNKDTFVLPDSVKVIVPYAFMYQKTIKTVVTNNGLKNIGKAAFYFTKPTAATDVSSIKAVSISQSVENIGASILLGCSNVNFTIDDGNDNYSTDGNLVYLGDTLVMYLGFSATVQIRDGITAIADAVFMNNATVTSITIPDSVKSIGFKAFDGCSKLATIHIGSGVETIDDTSFGTLKVLSEITVSEDNGRFKAVNNVLYTKDGKKLILAAARNGMTELNIDDAVTEIGDYAFAYHATLKTAVLPDAVRIVGNYAFYECKKLELFYGSPSLEVIGDYAFGFAAPTSGTYAQKTQLCNVLKTVLLYDKMERVGASAFYGQYGIENLYLKMSYNHFKDMVSESGTNIKFLTYGCQVENSASYVNNDGAGIVRSLYSEEQPTIGYDGYSWFYFDEEGKPRLWDLTVTGD